MKICNFKSISAIVAVLAMTMAHGSNAQADLVSVTTALNVASDIDTAAGVNEGGLVNEAGNINNGSDALNFLLTVDDSADTGAIFEVVVTAAGVTTDTSLPNANSVRSNSAGGIQFGTSALQDTLTFTVGTFTEVTSTGASIVFDGFPSFDLQGFTINNDRLTYDGVELRGTVASSDGTAVGASPTIRNISLVDNDTTPTGTIVPFLGSGVEIGDGNEGGRGFTIRGFEAQFTVTAAAVPEPSSLALLLVGGLGVAARRKRA